MKKNTKFKLICICSLFFILNSYEIEAQSVGINTDTPSAALEITGKSSESNYLKISDLNNNLLMSVDNTGKLSLGVSNTSVLVDIRNSIANTNVLGLGDILDDASVAGMGALKYNRNRKKIQYSDGTQWLIAETEPMPDFVIAENSNITVNLMNDATTKLTQWNVLNDSKGLFKNGVFTAPREGLYIATFSVYLKLGDKLAEGSYLEGTWQASTGATIKAISSYPLGGGQFVYPGVICSGIIKLNRGDTLYPELYQKTGSNSTLRTGINSEIGFNNLSIVLIQQ